MNGFKEPYNILKTTVKSSLASTDSMLILAVGTKRCLEISVSLLSSSYENQKKMSPYIATCLLG